MNNVVTVPSYPASANPVRKLVIVMFALMVGGSLAVHGAGNQKAAKRQQKDALLERYDVDHNGTSDADEHAAVERDFWIALTKTETRSSMKQSLKRSGRKWPSNPRQTCERRKNDFGA